MNRLSKKILLIGGVLVASYAFYAFASFTYISVIKLETDSDLIYNGKDNRSIYFSFIPSNDNSLGVFLNIEKSFYFPEVEDTNLLMTVSCGGDENQDKIIESKYPLKSIKSRGQQFFRFPRVLHAKNIPVTISIKLDKTIPENKDFIISVVKSDSNILPKVLYEQSVKGLFNNANKVLEIDTKFAVMYKILLGLSGLIILLLIINKGK